MLLLQETRFKWLQELIMNISHLKKVFCSKVAGIKIFPKEIYVHLKPCLTVKRKKVPLLHVVRMLPLTVLLLSMGLF